MKNDGSSRDAKGLRIDVAAFARDRRSEHGSDRLAAYPRLMAEAAEPLPQQPVDWSVQGEPRAGEARPEQPWLHLQAETQLPLTCQRCLEPVLVGLAVDRWFRFVRDEATAEIEDEQAEEDVLALGDDLALHALIEDELLLTLPVVPMHEQCPVAVKLAAADPDFEDAAAPEHPFASLKRLRDGV